MYPLTKQNSKKFVPFVLLGGIALSLGILAAIIFPTLTGATQTTTETTYVFELRASPRVGVYVDQNLVVVDVVDGSPAEAAGINVGDVVEKVNGVAVPENKKGKNRFDRIDKSKNVKIDVTRGDEKLVFDVSPIALLGREGAPTPTPVPQGVTGF